MAPKRGVRWWRAVLAVASVAVAFAVLASCVFAGMAAAPAERAPGTAVVVASFNFPESELLAAI